MAGVATKPKLTDIMAEGQGCLGFAEAEEATAAIAALNGTEIKGKTIEADVWTTKSKDE